jgi:hypothetical protein
MAIIVDYCGFEYMEPLAEFHPFNDSEHPASVRSRPERKKLFRDVAVEVLKELEKRRSMRTG